MNDLHSLRLRLMDWTARQSELTARLKALEIERNTAAKLVGEYEYLLTSGLRSRMRARGYGQNQLGAWLTETAIVPNTIDGMMGWLEGHPE